MPDRDQTVEFLKSLPEIGAKDAFAFACHPEIACFNACCADLNLMLTPYDVLRLRRHQGVGSESFINAFCGVAQYPDTGFPRLQLAMNEDANRTCPFVTLAGCSVYPDRPSACRTYPIGRATRLNGAGETVERFFVVREPHCRGFEVAKIWTAAAWMGDQGLIDYNRSNDRYMELMARQKERGKPIETKQANMALLALYQLDAFQDFIRDMKVFSRLNLPPEEQERILSDEAACLEFGFEWMEMVVFGKSERLTPKRS